MRRRSNTKTKRNYSVLFLATACIAAAILINVTLRPIIMSMAVQYGSASLAESINDAVTDTFDNNEFGYSDFVSLSYNNSGFVTAVTYNSAKINQLKLALSENLLSRLDRLKASKIKIPIGSASGDINLSGRGPYLKIRIAQSSLPDIQLISSTESLGINTVKHEILVRITINSTAYLPPKKQEFSYTQDFVIAQTIIVGDIPKGFTGIG